jgi:hypothetical protein
MLLQLIAQYYKFLWMGLGCIAFLKIMLSFFFHGNLAGINGIIFAVFKWYGEEEQEMEEFSGRRFFMRIHNIVTIFFYIMLLIIIAATILPLFLGPVV